MWVPAGTVYAGAALACASCPEYDPAVHNQQGCSPAATDAGSVTVPPGRYLAHFQSEGRNVPDVQSFMDVQADTAYSLCYFVSSTRPQKDLP